MLSIFRLSVIGAGTAGMVSTYRMFRQSHQSSIKSISWKHHFALSVFIGAEPLISQLLVDDNKFDTFAVVAPRTEKPFLQSIVAGNIKRVSTEMF